MQVNSQYSSYVSTFSGVRTGNRSSPADECNNFETSSFSDKLSEKSRAYELETESNVECGSEAINPDKTIATVEPTYGKKGNDVVSRKNNYDFNA